MRALIGIVVFGLFACGGEKKKDDRGKDTPGTARITSKEVDGVRIVRIPNADGTVSFVRADAMDDTEPSVVICDPNTTSCKVQKGAIVKGGGIPVCPCDKTECKEFCHPWPPDPETRFKDILVRPEPPAPAVQDPAPADAAP